MNRKALTLVFPLAFLFCAQAYAQTVDELIKKASMRRAAFKNSLSRA